MNEIANHTVKLERVLYKVEVWVWNDAHQTISYDPIPEAETRKDIDEKVARWVPHYRKQQQK